MDTTTTDERRSDDSIGNLERFNEHVAKLKPSQKTFVTLLEDWMKRRRTMLVVVSGGPGSGKTFTVIETLKHTNLVQLKMAYAARLANNIGGRTLHSTLMLQWGEGSLMNKIEKELANVNDLKECLEKSQSLETAFVRPPTTDVVVIDEVGMIPFWLTFWIIKFLTQNRPTLVVCMGDSRQLRPVVSQYNLFGAYELFESNFSEVHRIDMVESVRFVQNYETHVEQLRYFVDQQDADGMFQYLREHYPVVEEFDATVLDGCSRAMAHKNETVDACNKFYIKHLPGKPIRLCRVFRMNVDKTKSLTVKPNCDIFVTKNGFCDPAASNGTPLVFLRYDCYRDVLVCKDERQRTTVVKRNPHDGMFPVTVGFAGTVHKFQGDTLDDKSIVFVFDGSRDLNLVYTALSRVRCMEQIRAIVL